MIFVSEEEARKKGMLRFLRSRLVLGASKGIKWTSGERRRGKTKKMMGEKRGEIGRRS